MVLGQYLDMYIVAVSEEGLLVVDQHNAHERILYEKFLEIDRAKSWPRKMPLIPEILELAPSEALAFEENRALLEDAGFLVEPMGGRSYALEGIPGGLQGRGGSGGVPEPDRGGREDEVGGAPG